jgi:hypothetical protein
MTNAQAILQQAQQAGNAAFEAEVPQPMIVTGMGQTHVVDDGVCGFAWVKIKGNTAFGRYCAKQGYARRAYGGGLAFYPGHLSQSYDRKMAWARAFARVLESHGISAYATGHLD